MEKQNLNCYSAADLVVHRVKSEARSAGDGQETDSPVNKTSVPAAEAKLPVLHSTNLPKVEEVAKELTKVSLFSNPDAFLTTPPKSNKLKKQLQTPIFQQPISANHSNKAIRKEPRFIPYEPYKACVKPIIRNEQTKHQMQLAIPTASTITDKNKVNTIITDFEAERIQWEEKNIQLQEENVQLQNELKRLQTEVANANQQLSTQLQVNNELKKLLVASVGEDVQGRVQCLTEDKARMATMIRKYSEKVDKDYEEKERIAIQCDLFRSKFLATSLLLDDLAQWKGILIQKVEESKEAVKVLLEERDVVHPLLVDVFRHLYQLQAAFDPLQSESVPSSMLSSADSVSLCIANSLISEGLRDRLLGTLGRAVGHVDIKIPAETRTPGEKIALQLLEDCTELMQRIQSLPYQINKSNWLARFHSQHEPTMNCCGKCNGEIIVV